MHKTCKLTNNIKTCRLTTSYMLITSIQCVFIHNTLCSSNPCHAWTCTHHLHTRYKPAIKTPTDSSVTQILALCRKATIVPHGVTYHGMCKLNNWSTCSKSYPARFIHTLQLRPCRGTTRDAAIRNHQLSNLTTFQLQEPPWNTPSTRPSPSLSLGTKLWDLPTTKTALHSGQSVLEISIRLGMRLSVGNTRGGSFIPLQSLCE